MALRTEATGQTTETLVHEYDWKDVVLYALGCGATKAELDFLYEGRGPKVLPTYAVVPTFDAMMAMLPMTGGDMLGVVHGSQNIKLHAPLKPEGTLTTVGTVAGVYDLKRLAQAVFTTETKDAEGTLVFETTWTIIFLKDGGFGGERPPRTPRVKYPERDPDFEVTETTSPTQALLYRLSGDINPLHADPEIGEKAGFGEPILHGLCTYGYVGRALVNEVCEGDPARLVEFDGRFTKPVWPGDTLVIQ
ncbi:MAG: MaoC/PaaZ C-terminal domain-containing protein, partial [Myxococcota bacterium]